MSLLRHLGHERVTLQKRDGTTIEFEAHIQPDLIVVDGVDIPFQEEDLVIRRLRNGVTEHYRIERATQYGGTSGMPPHYQLQVRKLTSVEMAAMQTPPIEESQAAVDIFISHSSGDLEVAEKLTRLLRVALRLRAETIRCTSVDGHRLPGGANTDQQLKQEIRDSKTFIGIISPRSVQSMYVLFELGARWGAGKHLVPLLAPGATVDELVGPLKGLNALRADVPAQIHQLLRELASALGVAREPPDAYQSDLDELTKAKGAPPTTATRIDPIKGLSESATELLLAGADDHRGIMVLDTSGGVLMQAHGKQFIQPGSARSEAQWRAALEELAARDFVRHDQGSLWIVTEKGFKAADMLRQ